MRQVKAFAPATIANLCVGYDVLGLALHSIGDEVMLTENNVNTHRITHIDSHSALPYDIHKNSCTAVIHAMQNDGLGTALTLDVAIKKGFKAGSGLGSSAASSVAAAVAFNQLLEKPLPKYELLKYCAEGERIACGAPILDNVAASLHGGLVLIQQQAVVDLPFIEPMYALVVFQEIEIRTEDARAVLPNEVPMATATAQASNLALFVHALHTKNKQQFSQSFHDLLAQPYRKALIPNFDALAACSIQHKALGFGISGSGPTVFALCENEEQAKALQSEMLQITSKEEFNTFSTIEDLSLNHTGAKIINL